MPKVLIINPYIPTYRVPIFQMLATNFELTVLHSGSIIDFPNINFKQIIVPIRKLGPFYFYPKSIHSICNEFDVVISEANIRYLDRIFLILNPFRKYKWIAWGIGVSASYQKRFNHDTKFDLLRHFIFKRADALIFYSSFPIQKYLAAGFSRDKLFVANNTTFVNNSNLIKEKEQFLFIGTLYREKQIFDLLESYKLYCHNVDNPLILRVVGDGPERSNIENWIIDNNLCNLVIVEGSIYADKELEIIFKSSLLCISPGQAGLSVLTSMGYGVPFVTKVDAITGGEIFNIKHLVNGVLYNNNSDLEKLLCDVHYNREKYYQMGINAKKYYDTYCTIDLMVDSIIQCCNYVLSERKF